MEHIDAIDNGVDVASGPLKYDVSSHLSARVARLNPRYGHVLETFRLFVVFWASLPVGERLAACQHIAGFRGTPGGTSQQILRVLLDRITAS